MPEKSFMKYTSPITVTSTVPVAEANLTGAMQGITGAYMLDVITHISD